MNEARRAWLDSLAEAWRAGLCVICRVPLEQPKRGRRRRKCASKECAREWHRLYARARFVDEGSRNERAAHD